MNAVHWSHVVALCGLAFVSAFTRLSHGFHMAFTCIDMYIIMDAYMYIHVYALSSFLYQCQ